MNIDEKNFSDPYYWENLGEKLTDVRTDLISYATNPHHYTALFIWSLNEKLLEVQTCLDKMAENLNGE